MVERFLKFVTQEPTSGCSLWTGGYNDHGYGKFTMSGKTIAAHRAAYILFVGPIKDGLVVMHSCDNPSCVNHEHLKLGTQSENIMDASKKKRHRNSKKTHCKYGHEFTDSNTGINKRGDRYCRTCDNARRRKVHHLVADFNNPKETT